MIVMAVEKTNVVAFLLKLFSAGNHQPNQPKYILFFNQVQSMVRMYLPYVSRVSQSLFRATLFKFDFTS